MLWIKIEGYFACTCPLAFYKLFFFKKNGTPFCRKRKTIGRAEIALFKKLAFCVLYGVAVGSSGVPLFKKVADIGPSHADIGSLSLTSYIPGVTVASFGVTIAPNGLATAPNGADM